MRFFAPGFPLFRLSVATFSVRDTKVIYFSFATTLLRKFFSYPSSFKWRIKNRRRIGVFSASLVFLLKSIFKRNKIWWKQKIWSQRPQPRASVGIGASRKTAGVSKIANKLFPRLVARQSLPVGNAIGSAGYVSSFTIGESVQILSYEYFVIN